MPLHHVVEDRLADRDLFVGAMLFAIAAHLGSSCFVSGFEQHDAAAVGLDPFEDQLHDPSEQLVDIERVAHGQGRAIHDLQIAARPGEPLALRRAPRDRENAASLLLADRTQNPRTIAGCLARNDIDLRTEVRRDPFREAR